MRQRVDLGQRVKMDVLEIGELYFGHAIQGAVFILYSLRIGTVTRVCRRQGARRRA